MYKKRSKEMNAHTHYPGIIKLLIKSCFAVAILLAVISPVAWAHEALPEFIIELDPTAPCGGQSAASGDVDGASLANQITLVMNGPAAVNTGDTFNVTVEAQNVPAPGLYGVQFEINFDPALVTVDNLQVNPDFSYVLKKEADNVAGKMTVVASRQGKVAGLTGNVTLLTFEVTAGNTPCNAVFAFEDVKFGDAQANPFFVNPKSYKVIISNEPTPEPTDEPTAEPTDEPTAEPTDEPTPEPTDEPTPEPTDEPTAEPTDEPTAEPTDEPTAEPTDEPTAEPTDEPTAEPTDEPTPEPTDEPTAEPTDEPTAEPTDEPTPEPTDEPTPASVFGQVILAGRAGNDWSGATVTVDDSGQSALSDTEGDYTILNVPAGPHTSISADAVGYLSASCANPTVTAPETGLLQVSLVSGDIDDDDVVDITDATSIGASFGETGPGLLADINQDEIIDIFDLILVSFNFGEEGPTSWVCQ
jgi:hypothetical protein